jgi:hypothetical protein
MTEIDWIQLLRPFIASTNARNGGDGLPGLDFISGWNCKAKKN